MTSLETLRWRRINTINRTATRRRRQRARMCKTEMIMRGSTALESANALFRRAQAPANAERLCTNIWDGVTATRSTRRWLHRGRAFAVAPSSFALDIPHVAFSTGEGISQRKAESSVSFSGARACARARAGVAWRRAAGGGRCGGAWRRAWRRAWRAWPAISCICLSATPNLAARSGKALVARLLLLPGVIPHALTASPSTS